MSAKRSEARVAAWAGFDVSTTGVALGVRSRTGEEAYSQTKMRGATDWNRAPAFELSRMPGMLIDVLDPLIAEGWNFQEATLSFSVRQHDLVILDEHEMPLVPALSWQANLAVREVLQLRQAGVERTVGRIEERFILPKLMWALNRQPDLRRRMKRVYTTGDWIAQMLTSKATLSTSDAISNGLLNQRNKELAKRSLAKADLDPKWFPPVIQSGKIVGRVTTKFEAGVGRDWMDVKERLAGAKVVAGLGDNHATGVGCGLGEKDTKTIVVSAGTSGTINRVCAANAKLRGQAACFEFYSSRLLLMMLADCCKWYDRFVAEQAKGYVNKLDELNNLALKADARRLRRVVPAEGGTPPVPGWPKLSLGEKVASTQFSIALELLNRVAAMLAEVKSAAPAVDQFVLTGGLSQSTFFQQVFSTGIGLLAPKGKALVSARKGPLRYQTAAYGALLNAMRPTDAKAARELCPTKPAAKATGTAKERLIEQLTAAELIKR